MSVQNESLNSQLMNLFYSKLQSKSLRGKFYHHQFLFAKKK